MVIYLLVFATALMGAAILTPFIARTAVRVDILDRPGGRKLHTSAVPRLGGVAVALGLTVALGVSVVADAPHLASTPPLTELLPIIAGAVLVFAAGLWDDIDPRSPMFKLAVELAATLIIVAAGISITRVTFFGTTYALGWMGQLLTVLWILGLTNAFNLIDGLDGLASGLVAIAGGHVRRGADRPRGGGGRMHARRARRGRRRLSRLQPSPGQDISRRLRESARRVSPLGDRYHRAAERRHDLGSGRSASDLCPATCRNRCDRSPAAGRGPARCQRQACRAGCAPSARCSRPTVVTFTID